MSSVDCDGSAHVSLFEPGSLCPPRSGGVVKVTSFLAHRMIRSSRNDLGYEEHANPAYTHQSSKRHAKRDQSNKRSLACLTNLGALYKSEERPDTSFIPRVPLLSLSLLRPIPAGGFVVEATFWGFAFLVYMWISGKPLRSTLRCSCCRGDASS